MSAMIAAKKKALGELIKKMRGLEAKGPKKPEDEELDLEGVGDKAQPLEGSERKVASKAEGVTDVGDLEEGDEDQKTRADFFKRSNKGKPGAASKNIVPKGIVARKAGRPNRKV